MNKFFTSAILAASLCALTSCKKEETAAAPEAAKVETEHSDKPIQHLKLKDITSLDEAKKVFKETNAKIKSKTKLDAVELGEIHIITYSLEKAIAFFAENLSGKAQETAKEMAVLVEEIHLASENNRKEDSQKNIAKYFALVDGFAAAL